MRSHGAFKECLTSGRHITIMYKLLKTSLCDLWRTGQSAKIDMRTMRRIIQRPLAQLAAIIQPASRAEADRRAQDHIDPGRRFAMRIPSSVAEVWIGTVAGAFLISLCFLVGFIAADAWMSRGPTSLQSICSNVLELYKSRDDITDNEKWQQELNRLHDDCTVALSRWLRKEQASSF
jgi:hypothetical protein